MINDERWHGPFFREKSGSFKNNAKYAIFRDFLGFFIFCKKRRHTIEKLMSFLESPVFFWSPCKISCLEKVWFIQKWLPSDRDWRVFCDFWPYWMNHNSKSTGLTEMRFCILKEILVGYLPWKFEPQSFSGSWPKGASVCTLFEWSKIDLGQFLEFGRSDGLSNGCYGSPDKKTKKSISWRS